MRIYNQKQTIKRREERVNAPSSKNIVPMIRQGPPDMRAKEPVRRSGQIPFFAQGYIITSINYCCFWLAQFRASHTFIYPADIPCQGWILSSEMKDWGNTIPTKFVDPGFYYWAIPYNATSGSSVLQFTQQKCYSMTSNTLTEYYTVSTTTAQMTSSQAA